MCITLQVVGRHSASLTALILLTAGCAFAAQFATEFTNVLNNIAGNVITTGEGSPKVEARHLLPALFER